mmetsp:Transcript_37018/g.104502  ORF Transcript_37018/g.104502 Transcript_37018/m.104502 type:complete len:326 (+) Transcript_37018:607-1584(+)
MSSTRPSSCVAAVAASVASCVVSIITTTSWAAPLSRYSSCWVKGKPSSLFTSCTTAATCPFRSGAGAVSTCLASSSPSPAPANSSSALPPGTKAAGSCSATSTAFFFTAARPPPPPPLLLAARDLLGEPPICTTVVRRYLKAAFTSPSRGRRTGAALGSEATAELSSTHTSGESSTRRKILTSRQGTGSFSLARMCGVASLSTEQLCFPSSVATSPPPDEKRPATRALSRATEATAASMPNASASSQEKALGRASLRRGSARLTCRAPITLPAVFRIGCTIRLRVDSCRPPPPPPSSAALSKRSSLRASGMLTPTPSVTTSWSSR